MNVNRRGVRSAAAILIFILLLPLCLPALAETEREGDAREVLVAGNRNLYPIEYYDAKQGEFSGILPSLLVAVSERTGIRFTYVKSKESASSLAESGEVMMVTAFSSGSISEEVLPVQVPVLSASVGGEETALCIGFTADCPVELREKITSELNKITDTEKVSLALSYVLENPKTVYTGIPVIFAEAFLLLAVAVAAVYQVRRMKKRKRERIFAMTDSLTGIGNAAYFYFAMNELNSSAARREYYVAYLAPDGSKRRLGTDTDDELQKRAARKLTELASPNGAVARIGDGVFALLYRASNGTEAEERIKRVLKELITDLKAAEKGTEEPFLAGIVSLAGEKEPEAKDTLETAKKAFLYALRHSLPYAFVTEELLKKNNEEEQLRLGVSKAIENGEFELYLQFIVDRKTQSLCGAEVLSRWDHHEFGLMAPNRYISILRATGTITKHDYCIFEKLCSLLSEWKNTPLGGLFYDCNFTRIAISEPDFADRIREISEKYQFDHGKLVLEVTEDTLAENGTLAAENLAKCKAMGFKVAIDDLGSGFSAIADLYGSEIDIAKIDREFVIGGVTEKGKRLLDSMISLAHSIGVKALCEGIETDEQQKMILATDCDYIQGFAYSHVMPLSEAVDFVNEKISHSR